VNHRNHFKDVIGEILEADGRKKVLFKMPQNYFLRVKYTQFNYDWGYVPPQFGSLQRSS